MYIILMAIPEGWGISFFKKVEIVGGGRRGLREIPSAVGEWIFSETMATKCSEQVLICPLG